MDGGGPGIRDECGCADSPRHGAVRSEGRVNAVIGIGVNVNFDPSEHAEIAGLATSVYKESGRRGDRTAILREVLERMDGLYAEVKTGTRLTERWAAEMETLGRHVTVRWKDQVISGVAESVDDGGSLILRQGDGSGCDGVGRRGDLADVRGAGRASGRDKKVQLSHFVLFGPDS